MGDTGFISRKNFARSSKIRSVHKAGVVRTARNLTICVILRPRPAGCPAASDINGELIGAESGRSVALSGSGEILVVGEPGTNRARVFLWDGI